MKAVLIILLALAVCTGAVRPRGLTGCRRGGDDNCCLDTDCDTFDDCCRRSDGLNGGAIAAIVVILLLILFFILICAFWDWTPDHDHHMFKTPDGVYYPVRTYTLPPAYPGAPVQYYTTTASARLHG